MFDPTIFENLKVAFENHLYDLDMIDQVIAIQDRKDQMDFATMSRWLAIEFTLTDQPEVKAELHLETSLQDLAEEILEVQGSSPGCSIFIRFTKPINLPITPQCERIEQALYAIWEEDIELTQTLSFIYGQESSYENCIDMRFKTKITEENMGEISEFLSYVLDSLVQLNEI